MNRLYLLHRVILRVGACLAAAALSLVLGAGLVAPVSAATFGTVVPIGGQAADIALDEPRGLLYIANFTANRIDVMSLSDNTIQSSINVAPQPGSLALSPDGNWRTIFVPGEEESCTRNFCYCPFCKQLRANTAATAAERN